MHFSNEIKTYRWALHFSHIHPGNSTERAYCREELLHLGFTWSSLEHHLLASVRS
jgi:hypothetical protein